MMIRVICSIVALTFFTGCEKKRTPARYLIPAGYEGVVITVFEQPGFPGLPIKDGFRVHSYPNDGILITSSNEEFGWAKDETLDVMQDGSYRPIPNRHSGGRCERVSHTGMRTSEGLPSIEYILKTIGSDEYWNGKDAREHDKKAEQAMRKVKRGPDRQ